MHRLNMYRLTWIALLAAVIAFTSASFMSTASALELVMYRRAGCPWCAAWDREIGPIYGKTDVGRRLPIRFIDLERANERKFALKSPVRFTPTFVLVDEDREIARIEGYPGEDFFWGALERLLQRPLTKADDGSSRAANWRDLLGNSAH
jgi:thioredoxin-related protein